MSADDYYRSLSDSAAVHFRAAVIAALDLPADILFSADESTRGEASQRSGQSQAPGTVPVPRREAPVPDSPDSEDAATATPEPEYVAPPGHSRAGHRVHGWCSRCPGREVWEELLAWRLRDNESADESPAPDRALAPSTEAARG